MLAEFDQCQLINRLTSLVTKMPVKKRTFVLTNQALHLKLCPGDHVHQPIQGSEGGVERSQAAQEYPEPLCEAICQAFLDESDAK